jgi:Ca2+-binding RTX toxin-like protein
MKGNGGHNLMFGKGRADTMRGYGERDYLNGGTGSDKVYGGSGGEKYSFERALGGPGSDSLYGGDGRDFLIGGLGADKLYGGPTTDYISTGVGFRIPGSACCGSPRPAELDSSDDVAYGGSGNDNFEVGWAKGGVDRFYGEDGNDRFSVNQSELASAPVTKEIVDCGPGNDYVIYDAGVDVVMDNCETQIDHYFSE